MTFALIITKIIKIQRKLRSSFYWHLHKKVHIIRNTKKIKRNHWKEYSNLQTTPTKSWFSLTALLVRVNRTDCQSINNRAVKSIQLDFIVKKITSHLRCLKQTLRDVWPRGLAGPLDSFLTPECTISIVKVWYESTTLETV